MEAAAALAAGATAGAALRWALAVGSTALWGDGFPWGTLAANVVGCFLLGLLLAGGVGRAALSPTLRLALATGFCGSLTTFSTLTYETLLLAEHGALLPALGNLLGSLVLGMLAMLAGVALGRALA